MTPTMRGDKHRAVWPVGAATQRARTVGPAARQCPLQEEGAYLIDDAGALADQAFAHPMEIAPRDHCQSRSNLNW